MIIGVPKEIKTDEGRVAATPAGVDQLTRAGHSVLVEASAGVKSGLTDEAYVAAGAKIVGTAAEVFAKAEMIVKVKEPLPPEWPLIRKGQIVFTYFHFAASRALTDAMRKSGAACVAYETLEERGRLPLLTPMSEVAGRMAVQEGAKYLEAPFGGVGILLGGVPGVEPARVVVIGGGVVGYNAAKIAAGMGANVTILDVSLDRLRELSTILPPNVVPIVSNAYNIRDAVKSAHLVVGAVLVPGAKAPSLVTRDMLRTMRRGAVVVDVAVDQGGCIETCRPTTHSDPIYVEEGVTHYCVANMPGGVPQTSTFALTNATIPWALRLAKAGVASVKESPALSSALNVYDGKITHRAVAEAFDMEYAPVEAALR
jgi:alanine dehydrogenase